MLGKQKAMLGMEFFGYDKDNCANLSWTFNILDHI